MEDQQLYKSFKKIFDSTTEGINKEQLDYHIGQLEALLNGIAENVKEKATNTFEIKGSRTPMGLHCNKRSDESMQCEYYIKIYLYNLYNEDYSNVIECHSDSQYLPYKIECTHYSSKLVELSDSISFIKDIIKTLLDIYDTLEPGVLKNLGKQSINISTVFSTNSDKQRKENPEIYKHGNLFIYNNGRSIIKMDWRFY